MAQIIVEERVFKDRESGVSTNYMYFAVKGGSETKQYEVQLKNLVGSEKMALQMIADMESVSGETVSRKSNEEEKEAFKDKNSDSNGIDLFED